MNHGILLLYVHVFASQMFTYSELARRRWQWWRPLALWMYELERNVVQHAASREGQTFGEKRLWCCVGGGLICGGRRKIEVQGSIGFERW